LEGRETVPEHEEKKSVDLVCDSCGRRGCVNLHSPIAEALHARLPQDKITQVLCSKCSEMRREEDLWTLGLGSEEK
jgi:hypothetical protein